jgi:hypothetical protein
MLDSYPRGPSSEQPVHPGRGFAGREQVRANWSTIFDAVPIFAAELVNDSRDNNQVWSDWRWSGTRQDAAVWTWPV